MKKLVTVAPYAIAVRPVDHGWEVLCTPGPLSRLLSQLAGIDQRAARRREAAGGRVLDIIPLTPALDQALTQLVDALIGLRYETGRVQLELFAPALSSVEGTEEL